MWYQTTSPKLTAANDFCTYPKSDFAEVTFDYHANVGLQYSPDKLRMNIKSVTCRLNYERLVGETVEHLTAATIVNVQGDSREIVSRFAIQARYLAETAPLTRFHVVCDFTYKRYGTQNDLTQTCNQDFQITDCTGPEIDKPCPLLNDARCPADKCVGSSNPAPYEACGGNIITADAQNTVFTSKSGADKKCCEFCGERYETTCTAISSLPSGIADIKRCEPKAKSTGSNTVASALMAESNSLTEGKKEHTSAMALLGASALVALVALVVVKRQHDAVKTKQEAMADDAYYPLLS
jgi:hypothetical protein